MSKSTSNYMFDDRGLAFQGVLGCRQETFSLAVSEILGDLRPRSAPRKPKDLGAKSTSNVNNFMHEHAMDTGCGPFQRGR
jgi:hypothetical protein